MAVPRDRPLPRLLARRSDASALYPDARSRSSTAHVNGTRFGIHVDPADGLLAQGAAGLSVDLDGRQGRRLGGDAASRQGGGDQRALVQRAARDGAVGDQPRRCRRRRLRRPRRSRRSISTSASGTRPAATFTTSSMPSTDDGGTNAPPINDAKCRPNQTAGDRAASRRVATRIDGNAWCERCAIGC